MSMNSALLTLMARDALFFSLRRAGDWYDAGDHGKYVVNGGIALWTMLNQYERAK
jgi:hypothetical protein